MYRLHGSACLLHCFKRLLVDVRRFDSIYLLFESSDVVHCLFEVTLKHLLAP